MVLNENQKELKENSLFLKSVNPSEEILNEKFESLIAHGPKEFFFKDTIMESI